MQPLYNDEYGILSLISTQPLDPQSRLRYGSVEGLLEPSSWIVRLKKRFSKSLSKQEKQYVYDV